MASIETPTRGQQSNRSINPTTTTPRSEHSQTSQSHLHRDPVTPNEPRRQEMPVDDSLKVCQTTRALKGATSPDMRKTYSRPIAIPDSSARSFNRNGGAAMSASTIILAEPCESHLQCRLPARLQIGQRSMDYRITARIQDVKTRAICCPSK